MGYHYIGTSVISPRRFGAKARTFLAISFYHIPAVLEYHLFLEFMKVSVFVSGKPINIMSSMGGERTTSTET